MFYANNFMQWRILGDWSIFCIFTLGKNRKICFATFVWALVANENLPPPPLWNPNYATDFMWDFDCTMQRLHFIIWNTSKSSAKRGGKILIPRSWLSACCPHWIWSRYGAGYIDTQIKYRPINSPTVVSATCRPWTLDELCNRYYGSFWRFRGPSIK